MNPLDRLRVEKAAADCGFEMTAVSQSEGVELRSARFLETVFVRLVDEESFELSSSDPAIIGAKAEEQPIKVSGYGALYALLSTASSHARTKPDRVADEFRKQTFLLPRSTAEERLVVQRVGQHLFREALMDYWQGRCCISGLDVSQLLRASHIRPWALCQTDEQRLDVFNGLLLAPHLDALFDVGLMTVRDDGAVLLSERITAAHREKLGLPRSMMVPNLRHPHLYYLKFHRKEVWVG